MALVATEICIRCHKIVKIGKQKNPKNINVVLCRDCWEKGRRA